MTPEERLAEISPLQHGLLASWPTLKPYLEARRLLLTGKLVLEDNEQTRGRIKELNDLLELPERLQQEAVNLQQPPQVEGELP